jgi:hypothetical protein
MWIIGNKTPTTIRIGLMKRTITIQESTISLISSVLNYIYKCHKNPIKDQWPEPS